MLLSIVIITRNLGWNIARIVESALDVTQDIEAEVVVVDSASSDDTVKIAATYPIKVISLDANQRLSASGGRHVGRMQTSGKYVLFLDGDMELIPGWLEPALDIIEADPSIASISGVRIDEPKNTKTGVIPADVAADASDATRDRKHNGGAAMYRRSVLEETGGFIPYVISDEEPELCVRIRHKGYRIVQTNRPMVFHYSDPEEKIGTIIARARRRLYVGAGQNLRLLMGHDVFWRYVRERGFGIPPLIGLILGILLLAATVIYGNVWPFGLWLLAVVGVILLDAARKRSLYKAVYSGVLRILIADGTVRGFLMTPIDHKQVPVKFSIVK